MQKFDNISSSNYKLENMEKIKIKFPDPKDFALTMPDLKIDMPILIGKSYDIFSHTKNFDLNHYSPNEEISKPFFNKNLSDNKIINVKFKMDQPSYKETKRSLNKRSTTRDITGQAVTRHLTPEDRENRAAHTIQTWWRHSYRARNLHKKIFSPHANNSLHHQGSQLLPSRFRFLSAQTLAPLFTTVQHASRHLREILHDGALYPAYKSTVEGMSNSNDLRNFDNRLVFTAPFASYGSTGFTLDLDALFADNSGNHEADVYFKFNDWALTENIELDLSDSIRLNIIHSQQFVICNLYENDAHVGQFHMPGEDFVYHGYKGLNQYLSFFIFKIIESMPAEHATVKENIYRGFAALKPEVLINKLQDIAKRLIPQAEFDFVSTVKLRFEMIEAIHVHQKEIDFDGLRDVIQVNALGLFTQFIEEWDEVLKNSYFLIKGMLGYAQKHGADKISSYLWGRYKNTLGIEYSVLQAESLYQLPMEDILHADSQFLSQQYKLEENALREPYEQDKGHIIYRPNHGLVHSLRVVNYLSYIIEALQNHATPAYQGQFNDLDVLKIQKCLLFAVTGRENDNGFFDDQAQYYQFRQKSGDNFFDYYKNKSDFKPEELSVYREHLIAMGDPANKHPFHIVMNIAHKLDLPRCYTQNKMEQDQIPYIAEFINNSAVISELMDYACRCIEATGDRLYYTPVDASVSPRVSRETGTFVRLSQSASACIEAIAQVNNMLPLIQDTQHTETSDAASSAISF